MNKEQYAEQLMEITKYVTIKLGELQNSLTKEEIIKYDPMMMSFNINLIQSAVGKEDLISYLIEILNMADKFVKDADEVKERQLRRYREVKKEYEVKDAKGI